MICSMKECSSQGNFKEREGCYEQIESLRASSNMERVMEKGLKERLKAISLKAIFKKG